MKEDPIVFKRQKKDLKDIEPVKDLLSEIAEKEPKDIHDVKKRLTKK